MFDIERIMGEGGQYVFFLLTFLSEGASDADAEAVTPGFAGEAGLSQGASNE
jgi:hypothetical protein